MFKLVGSYERSVNPLTLAAIMLASWRNIRVEAEKQEINVNARILPPMSE